MIAERYRLDEQIGVGGMGVVWRATDLELGRVVALKQSQQGDDGQIRREARIGAGLHHPRVVTVFDVVVDRDVRWLVMEYLPSRSLSTILATDGPLGPVAAARIGAQVADALAAMHEQGIAHRDVKPGNILVTADGTAKLADFGIARWAEVTVTDSGHVGGTPGYLAPEVADGRKAGAAADVFSLGATLFAAVEGGSPWGSGESGPHAQLRRAIVGELEPAVRAGPLAPVLRELLRTNPSERPTALAAKQLLEDVSGDTIPVIPLSSGAPSSRRFRKGPLLIGAAVVVVAALVAGLVVFLNRDTSAANGDTVGDERTADPCSLVDRASLARFGTPTFDQGYGEFNRCGVLVRQSQEEPDLVDVYLEIQGPPEYPTQPHTPGQLGPIDKPPEEDGRCERSVRLPDGNMVVIIARHKEGWEAPLCDMADVLTDGAVTVLREGQIPRRPTPFPAESLANVDACALLTKADLTAAVGENRFVPERSFGRWICYWQREDIEVDVSFIRTYPQTPGEDDGELVKIGDRDAFVEMDTAGDTGNPVCDLDIVHRKYRNDDPVNKEWEEVVVVNVEIGAAGQPDTLCAAATTLATAIVDRLPSV